MSDLYYVRIRGSVVGPFRAEQVRELVERGKISRLHELSADRQTWRPLPDFPELAGTRAPSAGLPGGGASGGAGAPGTPEAQSGEPPPVTKQLWYYDDGGQPAGPVDDAGIAALVASGRVTPNTLVWTGGMKTWEPLRQTPLAALCSGSSAAVPGPLTGGSVTPTGCPPSGNVKHCYQCGRIIAAAAAICPGCGVQQPGSRDTSTSFVPGRHVPTYLVQAIFCTLFCCLPFGIVAIVYAAQAMGRLAAGDYRGAVKASDSARTWCWVSFLTGIGVCVLNLAMYVLFRRLLAALAG